MEEQPPEDASDCAPAGTNAATRTDTFAAIHDACRYVRADVVATAARASQMRADARHLKLRAKQLRAKARQLAEAQQGSPLAAFGAACPAVGRPPRQDHAPHVDERSVWPVQARPVGASLAD